jgi:hypothetical protein
VRSEHLAVLLTIGVAVAASGLALAPAPRPARVDDSGVRLLPRPTGKPARLDPAGTRRQRGRMIALHSRIKGSNLAKLSAACHSA